MYIHEGSVESCAMERARARVMTTVRVVAQVFGVEWVRGADRNLHGHCVSTDGRGKVRIDLIEERRVPACAVAGGAVWRLELGHNDAWIGEPRRKAHEVSAEV